MRVPCWDIQTDDHRVYLAEHDVTVSQCDDLVVTLAACFLSVGIYTMIVGHGYDKARNIQHVLTSVRINGKWEYADPSTELPLGGCMKFRRERLLSVPNIKVICDGTRCLSNPRKWDPETSGFVKEGVFVGVDGPPPDGDVTGRPKFAWLYEEVSPARPLGVGGKASQEAEKDPNKKIIDDCSKILKASDMDKKQSREDTLRALSHCAVSGFCQSQGIPPQVCEKVGGPIIDKSVDGFLLIWDAHFGNQDEWAQYYRDKADTAASLEADRHVYDVVWGSMRDALSDAADRILAAQDDFDRGFTSSNYTKQDAILEMGMHGNLSLEYVNPAFGWVPPHLYSRFLNLQGRMSWQDALAKVKLEAILWLNQLKEAESQTFGVIAARHAEWLARDTLKKQPDLKEEGSGLRTGSRVGSNRGGSGGGIVALAGLAALIALVVMRPWAA